MQIPRRTSRSVGTQGFPGARVPTGAPQGAFVQTTVPDVSGLTRLAGQMAEEEKRKADTVAFIAADNQLNELDTQIRAAVRQRKGKDAMAALAEARATFDEKASEVESSLANDTQREHFAARKAARWQSLYGTIEAHAAREAEEYATNEFGAAVTNRVNTAVSEPERASEMVEEATAIVKTFAATRGWSPEEYAEKKDQIVSKIHTGVITRMLVDGQDLAAKRYYTEHRAAVVGKDKLAVERDLEDASTLGDGMRQADQILRETTTFEEARQRAKGIEEPKVREEVEQRIRREYADRAAAERAESARAFQDASAILERTGDFHKIPMRLRTKMSPEENAALQRREDQMRHPKRETDLSLYTTLMTMSALNPATQRDFEQLNLLQFRDQLADDDFDRLLSLQRQLREATMRGDERKELLGEDVPDRALSPDIRLSIPQAWADSAATNPAYLRYLRNLRVPIPAPSGGTGDITLGGTP